MTPPLTSLVNERLLAGRTAFVTGGGSGVNLAIATAFATLGADVSICGRSEERLLGAAAGLRELGARVVTSVADVRDRAAVQAAFDRTADELAPCDIVVCGAAGNFLAPAESLSSNGFRAVVDIDLLGSFHAAHAAFEQLRQTRGSLLFVSGGQSLMPFELQAHVGAAKAGVDSLMRSLALEWGRHGIRVNSIVPGPVAGTEGMARLADHTGEDLWNDMVPLGRFATAEEIAQLAVVLVSPLASYVSGAQVVVDGGMALTGTGRFNQAVRAAFTASGNGA
ncbi:NAD(P)-dependent dehydrogenase, short-chain alcohol dehydrogenase family [Jatrophihabitans endophyticus]|uniref:NAD(P)-dependent dehydrogenase, short-chain alcohol dehydrogenase family n=1 Tax=Jatrophihabitans endophyticus TaxID=1206085 RepID=A0A1M5Q080_9ACTN|nr:SDR family oxidoreductase [Jatrophihabitans endophyticus]SHH07564.1 NAD(P)-dependent dehydrogenase, short-chain alcohol dehydrogenase family [Jatrophihabitans endophyticus]